MSIEERLDRLESLDEIRQLAAKYSVTLDMRDLDMHVNLYILHTYSYRHGIPKEILLCLRCLSLSLYIYIYICILPIEFLLYLSISLSIYIYIHTHTL